MFLLGLVLLALPAVAVWQAGAARTSREREAAYREARERCRAWQERLATPELVNSLLEERLAACSHRLVALAEEGSLAAVETGKAGHPQARPGGMAALGPGMAAPGSPAALAVAAERVRSELGELGLFPLVFQVIHQETLPGAGPGSDPLRLLAVTPDDRRTPELALMQDTLRFFLHYHLAGGAPESRFPEVARRFPTTFSGAVRPRFLASALRGSSVPVIFRGRSCLLFWQSLRSRNRVAALARELPPERIQAPGWADATTEAHQRTCLGGFLVILARDSLPDEAVLVTALVDDPTTRISLTPVAGGPLGGAPNGRFAPPSVAANGHFRHPGGRQPAATPGFAATPWAAGRGAEGEWILATATVVLDQVYEARIATRVAAAARSWAVGSGWAEAGVILGCLAGAVLWGLSALGGRALATSLVGQLWWGFLLASLLPLTFVWWLAGFLETERLEALREEARLGLRQAIGEYQGRFMAGRSRAFAWVRGQTFDPGFLRVLDPAQRAHLVGGGGRDPALGEVRAFLQGRLRPGQAEENDFQLVALVVAGVGGFSCEVNQEEATGEGVGGTWLARAAGESLPDRNPALAGLVVQREEGGSRAVREELAQETVQRLLRSAFGPDGWADLMLGDDQLQIYRLGISVTSVMRFLLPGAVAPRFVVYWLGSMRRTDRRSISRALASQAGPFRVYAVEQSRVGSTLYPWDGEMRPCVRVAARRVREAGRPLSFTFEE
ncbi:MAG: hypothetical protein GX442_21455 [Candidatus Riflebacteria bacterium]|nr:hypothetical protein [Candidatus Riflebacteria bacterium]